MKHVGVVGLGLMGHGIAQMAAIAGLKVTAVDIDGAQLTKGMGWIDTSLKKMVEAGAKKGKPQPANFYENTMKLITPANTVSAVKDCDMIVEVIVENLEIKKKFFADLGKMAKPSAIFASNTSSFPITQLGTASNRADLFVGVHFFNPVQIMNLVEVIKTADTSDATFNTTVDFIKLIKKTPVACVDTPGFIVNRLLVPYMSQALLMLDRGDASVSDIDTAMIYGAGMPMGPLTLADYVGLDTCLSILEGWTSRHPGDPAFVVPASLKAKVAAGKFGRKSGEGFYKWTGDKVVGLA